MPALDLRSRRRVKTATDALGRSMSLNYDAQGNVVSRTRKDGAVITYEYDVLNRLKQANFRPRQRRPGRHGANGL